METGAFAPSKSSQQSSSHRRPSWRPLRSALGVLLPHHRLLQHHVRMQDPVHSGNTLAVAAGVNAGFTIGSTMGLMGCLGNTQLTTASTSCSLASAWTTLLCWPRSLGATPSRIASPGPRAPVLRPCSSWMPTWRSGVQVVPMLMKDELLRFFASGCFPHRGCAAPSHSDGRSAEQRIVPLQLLAMLGLYNIMEDVLLWSESPIAWKPSCSGL